MSFSFFPFTQVPFPIPYRPVASLRAALPSPTPGELIVCPCFFILFSIYRFFLIPFYNCSVFHPSFVRSALIFHVILFPQRTTHPFISSWRLKSSPGKSSCARFTDRFRKCGGSGLTPESDFLRYLGSCRGVPTTVFGFIL